MKKIAAMKNSDKNKQVERNRKNNGENKIIENNLKHIHKHTQARKHAQTLINKYKRRSEMRYAHTKLI